MIDLLLKMAFELEAMKFLVASGSARYSGNVSPDGRTQFKVVFHKDRWYRVTERPIRSS